MLLIVSALATGYLAGSLPFGVMITRLAGATDPRLVGSRNIGATNVLRTGRKDLAALTLLADALKGMLPVIVFARLDDGSAPVHLAVLVAVAAFVGHLYPIFLRFRGGKGVATFLGCLIGLAWPAALAFVAVWLCVAALTRYSSAAALAAAAATPPALLLSGHAQSAAAFAVLAVVLWAKHRANIARLLNGTETKIGADRLSVGKPGSGKSGQVA